VDPRLPIALSEDHFGNRKHQRFDYELNHCACSLEKMSLRTLILPATPLHIHSGALMLLLLARLLLSVFVADVVRTVHRRLSREISLAP
jgi:hypothetical protein